ncbi:hypothetical protein R3I94_001278 [Phoxinus phoxinus]
MSNTNQEKSSAESDQTKEQQAHVNRAHHDATLLSLGSPALYRLNTERKYVDGTDEKVRQWTYGRRDGNKQNKVILMVGEVGSGKTTMINTMINYLLGVKFEDQEFYRITEEEHQDQPQSQTHEITVYEAFAEENPTSLTIIDTPGYVDTEELEKDREFSEYLGRLFSNKDGIRYIDAVCFVVKASKNRLSEKQRYILQSFLSLFGRDIENNIVFLLTHSDGRRPTEALNVIKKAKIPCRRYEDKEPVHFLFNNQQKEKRDKRYPHNLISHWELGDRSMNEFFTLLEPENRESVQMTLEVLNERKRLWACVSNLKDRIKESKSKIEELTQIQDALRQIKDKIEKGKNFQFTVKRNIKEKVSIENEWWWNSYATCCSVCEENCHEWKCFVAQDPSWCSVMKDDYCKACTGKCHHSKHVRENKKYQSKTVEVIMTFAELKEENERTGKLEDIDETKYRNLYNKHETDMKEFENKIIIEKTLSIDLEKIKEEKSKLLNEAYDVIKRLSEITLKVDSTFTRQHLEFLIPELKEEGKDEWIKELEDLQKAGEEQRIKGL